MSFDVYVQCFKNGEASGIPRHLVRDAFGRFVTEAEPDYWAVRYDAENSSNIAIGLLQNDDNLVHNLSVERPCGDERLWEALMKILRLGPVVLYCPGEAPPMVASESAAAHLPKDMVDSLGSPVRVESGHDIVRRIKAA